jgi:general secretion pathway protein J
MTSRNAGFTLLEVLVSVLIFALASALAYGGLSALTRARAASDAANERFGKLQFAMGLIERDLSSIARRGVRNADGLRRPMLDGDAARIEFTRHGYGNALALPRAELERVGYLRREGELIRLRHPALDGAGGARPVEDVLIDGAQRLQFTYRDAQGRELHQWPPPRSETDALPRAVEFIVELEGYGELRRVIELPQEPPP